MSENKEKKDQFVIAYLNNLDFAKTCIEHSVQIAKILNKGLILLHIYDPLLTKVGVDEAESKLKELNSQITETVQLAAEKGVRIIPIASSGIDTETEFLLRSWAIMAGGTYLFLTDDSGIGNDHLEPTIGEYSVEKLNECMIRVICEYCGVNYTTPSQK